jgi:hypothetical protein
LASDAPNSANPRLNVNDWLELHLTQSGGFAGLTRQAKMVKSELIQGLADNAQHVLKQLWDHQGNALPSNPVNYADGQQLHVEVTTKHGKWVQTLNTDELPDELAAMCTHVNWKPL